MGKIIVWADKVLSLLAKVLVGVLASGVIVSVLLRYVFSISFVWSEEILTMVFVATTFFGAALGLREREHIAITHFTDHASKRVQTVAGIVVDLVILVVCAFLHDVQFHHDQRWIHYDIHVDPRSRASACHDRKLPARIAGVCVGGVPDA